MINDPAEIFINLDSIIAILDSGIHVKYSSRIYSICQFSPKIFLLKEKPFKHKDWMPEHVSDRNRRWKL